ncbi:alpha/beta hydrolase [Ktedonobacter sp. SOSP1-85]|uniref:alpha/beta fold hydrolase n=1 Tax=Ktedonobacter sp. SOSP1-85 TaxID=2778367 RepID=UPI0019150394|nr:alpha/beta hydrolase [Ktedonobacter sp. SOSP1-85]GHO74330.1 alpha/beta hydrolase [Ktedonobacter sp. SOSP1-85]
MSIWSEGDLQLDDVRIHYYRTGAGEKPPLVLLHGFSDNGLCWSEVVREWASDFDIILPDARGHGLSSGSASGNYRQRAMAEDVVALIQALNLGSVRLGGHSMGGGVAAVVASEWPELVRAVALEDAALFIPREQPTSSQEEGQRRHGWLFEVRTQSLEERKAACQKNTGWSEVTVEQWAISKDQLNMAILSAGPAPVIGERSPMEVLTTIRCPLLLVTGDPTRGAMITPEQAAQILTTQPRARELHIPNTGHCIRYDQPRAYAESVGEWLRNV